MVRFDEAALNELVLGRLRPPDATKMSKRDLLKRIQKKLQEGGKIPLKQEQV